MSESLTRQGITDRFDRRGNKFYTLASELLWRRELEGKSKKIMLNLETEEGADDAAMPRDPRELHKLIRVYTIQSFTTLLEAFLDTVYDDSSDPIDEALAAAAMARPDPDVGTEGMAIEAAGRVLYRFLLQFEPLRGMPVFEQRYGHLMETMSDVLNSRDDS